MSGNDFFGLPFFSGEHQALADRTARFVEREVAGHPGDEDDSYAVALVRALGREGLCRFAVPRAYGGTHDRPEARSLSVIRDCLAYGSALADTMFAMQGLGSYPVTLAGGEQLKRRLLPGVASGETVASFSLTEPEAGSDVGSISTEARREDDTYVLNGTKLFASNATVAGMVSLFARTGPGKGTEGLSAFALEGGWPGMSTRPIRLISPHPIGEIGLAECRVPSSHLLGEEGEGFSIAMSTLALFRTTVAAAAVGLGRRALDEAVGYARARQQFGRPIATFQGLQFYLADMAVEMDAARHLVYRAAWKLDRDEEASTDSSMAKLYATEAAQRSVDRAVQIHGGSGLVHGAVVERLYRDVRALRIYEGTTEIQRVIVARSLVR